MATKKSTSATVKLTSGYIFFQKGPAQTLRVVSAETDGDIILIGVRDRRGARGRIRFDLNPTHENHDVVWNLFSTLCKFALHNWELEEINLNDLIGCYIKADIDYYTDSQGRTFPRFSNYTEAPFDKLGNKVAESQGTF